jgi:membrane associated rhomboid family serine protease
MLPLSDDNSDRHLTPMVNYVLIAINILVFVLLQGMGHNLNFTYAFSTVPQEIMTGTDVITQGQLVRDPSTGQSFQVPGLQATPIPVWLTMVTSMFMHGGWAHLLGNMLFLWIFGDNIENRMGHVRYLVFYLLCGIIASLAHVFTTAALGHDMMTPSLGASGAISGVMGAYLILFPKRKVNVLMLRVVTQVPALVALGLWILLQVVSGMGVLGGNGGGGVAYMAHIGGFAAGMLLVKFFDKGQDWVDAQLALKRQQPRGPFS